MADASLREGGGDLIQIVFTVLLGLSTLQSAAFLQELVNWMTKTAFTAGTLGLTNGGLAFYIGVIGLLVTNDTNLMDPANTAGKGFWIALIYFSAILWIPDLTALVQANIFGQALTLFVAVATFAMINGDWFINEKLGGLGGMVR